MPAQKKVGVGGIDIQRRRFLYESLDVRGIFDFRGPEIEILQRRIEDRGLDERIVDRFQTPTLLCFVRRRPAATHWVDGYGIKPPGLTPETYPMH